MSQDEREIYIRTLFEEVIAQPVQRHFGLSLRSQTPTPVPTALLELTTGPEHLNPAQTVHGGVLTLVIDVACNLATIPTLSVGQTASTIASSFQLLNAVPGSGKKYEIEAKVLRRGRSIAFCEGEMRCEGKVVARGSVTKVINSKPAEKSKM